MVFGLSALNRVCDFMQVSVLNMVYNFARVCSNYKQGIACPKQGNKIEVVDLNRVCILGFFCPKQGQGFKPSAAHLYPNMGRVSPPPDLTRTLAVLCFPCRFQLSRSVALPSKAAY